MRFEFLGCQISVTVGRVLAERKCRLFRGLTWPLHGGRRKGKSAFAASIKSECAQELLGKWDFAGAVSGAVLGDPKALSCLCMDPAWTG